MCAPPFVTSCIFKDDVDEGTRDEMEKVCINFEVHLIDTKNKHGIHDTDDESFHENIRHGAIHFIISGEK